MAFPHHIHYYILLGAVASIVTTGQKRPVPTKQNDTKPSKKPQQIKEEDIKKEIPRIQLPVTKIIPGELIVIDSDSDEEDSIYVPKSGTKVSCHLLKHPYTFDNLPFRLVTIFPWCQSPPPLRHPLPNPYLRPQLWPLLAHKHFNQQLQLTFNHLQPLSRPPY